MRKVKFTQDLFDEMSSAILEEFPIVDVSNHLRSNRNPCFYDKNHYKLARGQLRSARHLIDQVAKDSVRLLKFSNSLCRCK
ncbi:hypothetical protein BD309DRAFT_1072639 [Dichomitus squalens]|nr:hypothetical protein BD309DRAFT_1072639 [Dichomitus squalens]